MNLARTLLKSGAIGLLMFAIAVAILWPVGYRHVYLVYAFQTGIAVSGGRAGAVYSVEGLPFWPPGVLSFPVDPKVGHSAARYDWNGFGVGVARNGEGLAYCPAWAMILILIGLSVTCWLAARRMRQKLLNRGFEIT